MDRFDRHDVQRYLDANYLTLEALATRAGVTPERVLELVDALCVPPHSHEARGVAVFASTFGEYTAPVPPEKYGLAEDLAAHHDVLRPPLRAAS